MTSPKIEAVAWIMRGDRNHTDSAHLDAELDDEAKDGCEPLYPQATVDSLLGEVESLNVEVAGLTAQNERLMAYAVVHNGVLRYCSDGMREAYAEQTARAERAEAQAEFYRARCNALQDIQSRMRDPERQMVCDILANGQDRETAGIGQYTAIGKQEG